MAEGKYGWVKTERKDFAAEHPDEPLFLVRAQDVLAPRALTFYAMLAESEGLHEIAEGVRAQCRRMVIWQGEHLDQVKFPDGAGEL